MAAAPTRASAKRGRHADIIGAFEDSESGDDDDGEEPSSDGLQVGDAAIAHHSRHAFFPGRISGLDVRRREFTLAWNLTSVHGCSTIQPYHLVFSNVPPAADEVGVGSSVLFPQGLCTAGPGSHSVQRYHEGTITSLEATYPPSAVVYVGEHLHGEADGKDIGYSGYARTFRCERGELRSRPNVFDLLVTLGRLDLSAADKSSGPCNASDDSSVHAAEARTSAAGRSLGDDGAASAAQVSAALCAPPAAIIRRSVSIPLDAYVSFAQVDRPVAMRLLTQLWRSGLSAKYDASAGMDHEGVVALLRRAAVCIACVSEEYSHSDEARQELLFVKKGLRKPIVPVRLDGTSDGSYEQSSVGRVLADEESPFDLREWAREGARQPVELDGVPSALLVRVRALPAVQAARRARVQ